MPHRARIRSGSPLGHETTVIAERMWLRVVAPSSRGVFSRCRGAIRPGHQVRRGRRAQEEVNPKGSKATAKETTLWFWVRGRSLDSSTTDTIPQNLTTLCERPNPNQSDGCFVTFAKVYL